jgi:hypothetical protein
MRRAFAELVARRAAYLIDPVSDPGEAWPRLAAGQRVVGLRPQVTVTTSLRQRLTAEDQPRAERQPLVDGAGRAIP